MPLIESSSYHPSFLLRRAHLGTILPNLFRRVRRPEYKRVRIDTADKDFIDLDISSIGGEQVAIITHGLEGSADRDYMRSIANALNKNGYDAIAINLRGCSGQANNLFSSYHSGKTDDLDLVVNYAVQSSKYKKIVLIGFSLGGNITLKYLGEKGSGINPLIRSAAAISVPVMLKDSADQLAKRTNSIYMRRFIRMLKPKIRAKAKRFPMNLESEKVEKIKDFYDVDNLYTAPAHGFTSAEDYWEKSSALQFLKDISIPTLLINAKDDPFLSTSCFPEKVAKESEYFYFEAPAYGGHVGFASRIFEKGPFWHEKRMIEFFGEKVIL